MRYEQGEVKELGQVGRKQIRGLVEQADLSSVTVRPYGVGFYRSEADFLEITPVGRSEFLLWSDFIVKRSGGGLFRFLRRDKRHIDTCIRGREAAIAVAHNYVDLSRQAFERKFHED